MEKRARKGEEKENPRGSPPRRKRQGGYYFGILDAECVMGLSKRRKRIVLFVGCREGGSIGCKRKSPKTSLQKEIERDREELN